MPILYLKNFIQKKIKSFCGQIFSFFMVHFQTQKKSAAFTMVELLIAMTISIIVIGATFSTIGTIYYGQKQLRVSQDFYKEVKFVMQRLVDLSRDNTIDYDRYFLELGPDPDECAEFHPDQQPFLAGNTSNDCHSATDGVNADCENTKANRALIGYTSLFYWDTNADNQPDRNMGGLVFTSGVAPTVDPCVQAFYEQSNNLLIDYSGVSMPSLFLIDRDRQVRRAVRRSTYNALVQGVSTSLGRLELQTQLGGDKDDDGVIDAWGPNDNDQDGTFEVGDSYVEWYTGGATSYCRLVVRENTGTKYYDIVGDLTDQTFCEQAHDWTPFTIRNLNIESLDLSVTPDRDPYLNFRNDISQVHPRTTIRLATSLTDPVSFGLDQGIFINSQTTASSRIFGNTR